MIFSSVLHGNVKLFFRLFENQLVRLDEHGGASDTNELQLGVSTVDLTKQRFRLEQVKFLTIRMLKRLLPLFRMCQNLWNVQQTVVTD
jgi:hypothetical protein